MRPRLTITKVPYGALPDGRAVDEFVLSDGVRELRAISYGAIITSLRIPDAKGAPGNVVLGYETLAAYLQDPAYLGAVVGRYANRIRRGRMMLDGTAYQLTQNEGVHHLHGGFRGLSRALWEGTPLGGEDAVSVRWEHISEAGDEGYPGRMRVCVTYSLRRNGDIALEYVATSDATTIVNLTQHTYFNLGTPSADILGHRLTIDADTYLPVDADLIPTGRKTDVAGSPFDFRTSRVIGESMSTGHEQLLAARGYDHTWVLRETSAPRRAAELYEPLSGRRLEIWTTEPGVQFYTGNRLGEVSASLSGRVLRKHGGLCLETQHFPNTPNEPSFPPVVLRKGERYRSMTEWRLRS